MKIQQHDGVVVVEEHGNPAGLRQAPRDMRRKRDAGLRHIEERNSRVMSSPNLNYI